MADKVTFELVSPERLLMSVEADMVEVPGVDGDFGVMAGHAPIVSTIRPGIVVVHKGEGEPLDRIFVQGGFAEVTPRALTVLAEQAIAVEDIDVAALDQEIINLGEDVRDARDDATRQIAQAKLDQLTTMREVAVV